MKKWRNTIAFIVLIIFIILQFIPYDKQVNRPVKGQDLFETATIPEDIGQLIKSACYDCHSQFVRFPWYANIAPVSWLVAKDIREGREKLDFSVWNTLPKREQLKLLDEIGEEVIEGTMPIDIYKAMHLEARLTDEQRSSIVSWADSFAEDLLE